MKVVVNKTYGGFCLSEKAQEFLGTTEKYHYTPRTDPRLVECVEKLGAEACDDCELVIEEIPDYSTFEIVNYDGMERVIVTAVGQERFLKFMYIAVAVSLFNSITALAGVLLSTLI